MSSPWSSSIADEEEEEEEDDNTKTLPDHIVILLDARPNMFETNAEGKTYFSVCLEVVLHLMKTKIIMSDKHTVGVTLFGTKLQTASNANIYELISLDVPDSNRIKTIMSLLADPTDFKARIGSVDAVCLRTGLWSCLSTFHHAKYKNDFRRIWIMTNDDNPARGDQAEAGRIAVIGHDANDVEVDVSLWHCNRSIGRIFSPQLFYTKIIPSEDNIISAGDGDFPVIGTRTVLGKLVAKRRQITITLHLTPTSSLSVDVYSNLMISKKPYGVNIDSRSNSLLTCQTRHLNTETGQVVGDDDVRHYLDFGNEKVDVSLASWQSIKKANLASSLEMHLIEFQPIDLVLNSQLNLSHSQLIQFNDSQIKGSIQLYLSLLKTLASKRCCAICGYKERLVAIYPVIGDAGGLLQLVHLPFMNDVRDVTLIDPVSLGTRQQVDAASDLVKSMMLDEFSCSSFSNPSLQKWYLKLSSLALGTDVDDDDDDLVPDVDGLENAKGAIDLFMDVIGLSGGVPEVVKPVKRKVAGAATTSKRVRLDDDDDDGGPDKQQKRDWKTLVETGAISKLTIPDLKEYCRDNGLKLGGKKQELIDRILEHMG